MSKGTLEFELPDENPEFKIAVHAGELSSAIWEVETYCRNKIKHGEVTGDHRRDLENIRDLICHLTDI